MRTTHRTVVTGAICLLFSFAARAEAPATRPVGSGSRAIVFVCSAASPMSNRMDVVKDELQKAINGLNQATPFDVIFFHDGKAESFAAGTAVAPTPQNKAKAFAFIQGMKARGTADAGAAFKLAFEEHPRLIYLLTGSDLADGDALPGIIHDLNEQEKAKINTIALLSKSEPNAKLVDLLRTIADENRGVMTRFTVEDIRQQAASQPAAGPATHPATQSAAPATELSPEQQKRLADAGALTRQVVLLYNQRKYREALPLAQRCVDIVREVHGEQDPPYAVYAQSLGNLAAQYDGMGDITKAEPLYRQALDVARQTLAEGNSLSGTLLNNLADIHMRKGDYSGAEPLLLESIEQFRQALEDKDPTCDPRSYLIGLRRLATLYDHTGNASKAEPVLRQVVEACRQVTGEKDPEYAASLASLALLYDATGDYAKAEPLFRQALKIVRDALGEKHLFYGLSLGNLGCLYLHTGDYAKAEPLLRQAMEIGRDREEKDTQFATKLNNLASLYQFTGDYARAEPLFREAVQVYEQAPGQKDPILYSNYLNNLAALYMDMGDYARAEGLFRKALEIRRPLLGEGHPIVASNLNNLATLYLHTGDYAKAEPLFRQSLNMVSKAFGVASPDYASSLDNLSQIYVARGNRADAEPLLRQALQIRRQALGEKHPDYAASLDSLAALYVQSNDYAKAEPLFLEAESIMRRTLDLTATIESERQQLGNEQTARGYLDNLLDGSRAAAVAGKVYAAAANWKGVVSLRQSEMRSVRQIAAGTVAPAPQQERAASLCRDLEASARRLAALTRGGADVDAAGVSQRAAEITSLSDRIEHLQAELSGLSESYRKSRQRGRHAPDEIARCLPHGTALVDVFQYTGSTPAHGDKAHSPERRLVGFIISAGLEAKRVELDESAPIEEAVEAWRQGSFGQTAAGREAGQQLRKLVWEPLAAKLGGATTVLISPDGPLSRLPLGALPGAEPGKYLIEEVSIATVPVPQALPELLAEKPSDDASPSLLLVGDVDYGSAAPAIASAVPASAPTTQPAQAIASSGFASRSAARGSGSWSWPALEGTRQEIDGVRESFQHRWPTGQLTSLRGPAATEQAVREAAAKSRYLHVATHGFFAPPQVKSALAPSTQPAGLEMPGDPFGRAGVTGFHPGLLSGIVLAGANHPQPDGDDGILTALEVEELDLTHVDLAVLSACETGLGQTAGGEGLLGLQRAFQVAGARTVVASLWKVPDEQTRQLMDRFYDNLWVKRMPKLQALREAQLWMLNQGATIDSRKDRGLGKPTTAPSAQGPGRLPPYFWAGFVLSGDWR